MKISVNENRVVLVAFIGILIFLVSWSVFADEKTQISLEEARNIALANVPGVIVESELDYDHGVLMYEFEIEIKDGSIKEIEINAHNGSVISVGDGH